MRSLTFVLMLFFHSIINATNVRADYSASDIELTKIEQNPYFQKVTKNYSSDTFKPYAAATKIKTGEIVWHSRLHKEQTPYKVSLIGANLNSWLENPQYFEVLQKQAKNFSVQSLLDNLQSFNPNLIFNNPLVVSTVLKQDIYTPYLTNIANYKKKFLQFSDISNVVSYTRRYHIYGTTVGSLPYFGRPVEGANRSINLGLLSGQLQEAIVKLPDTDIFLVAMINVIPNWLEEGWDIFQISQQELEILVYAFDRNGKMLGGAGVPMDFLQDGKEYLVEQKVRSKIWQEGTARDFYVWPSFKIINTKDKKANPELLTVTMPTDKRPTLNRQQRYILSALEYLRATDQNVNVSLFTPEGKRAIKIKRVKNKQKVVLANRILQHTNSILLKKINVESQNVALTSLPLTVKLSNMSKELNKEKEILKYKKFFPSNEGKKLEEVLVYGEKSLRKPIFTHTNELYYTNEIALYELEQDPVIYQREQRKYAVLPYNVKEYRRQFKKNTKELVEQHTLQLEDKLYWNDFRKTLLMRNDLYTKDMDLAFQDWKEIYQHYVKVSTKKLTMDRAHELYVKLSNILPILKERNVDLITSKYFDNEKKRIKELAKMEARVHKIYEEMSEEIANLEKLAQKDENNKQVSFLKKEEEEKYNILMDLLPNKHDVFMISTPNNSEQNPSMKKEIAEKLNELADFSKVDLELITYGLSNGKKSPLMKKKERVERKNSRDLKKKTRYLSFEGYMLGLTRAWSTRTRLIDRLDNL